MMSEKAWSPLVFWSRLKRALKPLLECDKDALQALGLHFPDDDKPLTAYRLCHAAAAAMAADGGATYEEAQTIANRVRRGKGGR